jgi:hypothetical protein
MTTVLSLPPPLQLSSPTPHLPSLPEKPIHVLFSCDKSPYVPSLWTTSLAVCLLARFLRYCTIVNFSNSPSMTSIEKHIPGRIYLKMGSHSDMHRQLTCLECPQSIEFIWRGFSKCSIADLCRRADFVRMGKYILYFFFNFDFQPLEVEIFL